MGQATDRAATLFIKCAAVLGWRKSCLKLAVLLGPCLQDLSKRFGMIICDGAHPQQIWFTQIKAEWHGADSAYQIIPAWSALAAWRIPL